MPRYPRKISSAGCYHIIQRGNNRQEMLPHPSDFHHFEEILAEYLEKYSIVIYHFCLMHNHFHLLVRCEDIAEVGQYMHGVQRSYYHYYHKKYTFVGHLSQGRFRSFPVDDDSYLLECGRYIENNPVRANIVSSPGDWPYSSYLTYAYGKIIPWIEPSKAYLGLANDPLTRQDLYRRHTEAIRPYEEILYKRLQKI